MSGRSEREYLLIVRWSRQFDPTRRVDVHTFTLPAGTQEAEFERFVTHEAGPGILAFSTRSEHPEAVYFLKVHEAQPVRGHRAGEVRMTLESMGIGSRVPALPAGVRHEARGFREIDLSEGRKES